MKFQPGDQVSFINEKQNGVVTKSTPGGRVTVRIEDGFEIEVLERELVKTGNAKIEPLQVKKEIIEINEESFIDFNKITVGNTITLVTIPEALGAVLSGSVEFYLVNNSEFEVLYTCYLTSGRVCSGKNAGSIKPGKNTMLFSLSRTELIDWVSVQFEILLYSQNQKPQISYIRKETEIVLPDLASTNVHAKGRAAFAKTTVLFDDNAPEEVQIKDLIEKWTDQKTTEKVSDKTSGKHLRKTGHQYFVNERTVDLHIEELVADFSGMNNAEMLNLQMTRFNEEMHNALRSHLKSIIFIHGVGKGVLKQSILKELKNYKGIRVREADPVKYGQGATEVLF
jgi:hypothetical protein